jgi:hypothetical protein
MRSFIKNIAFVALIGVSAPISASAQGFPPFPGGGPFMFDGPPGPPFIGAAPVPPFVGGPPVAGGFYDDDAGFQRRPRQLRSDLGFSSDHFQWCYNRYRTYDHVSNTYFRSKRQRAYCVSPFSQ